MFVKFGDTRGNIFNALTDGTHHDDGFSVVDPTDDSSFLLKQLNGAEYNVGSGVVTQQGIVIFDRYPNQDTSSVPFDQIIDIVKSIHTDLFAGEPIKFYIPKFSSNIYNETIKVQSRLLHEFDNAVLIPV